MKILWIIANIIANNIVWLACVLSAAAGYIYLGLSIAIVISIIQIVAYCYITHAKPYYIKLLFVFIFISVLTLFGLIIDSLFTVLNIIQFASNPWPPIAPLWIIGLWLNFAVTIYCILQHWFHRLKLMMLLSFVGFSLAYFFGVHLGAGLFPWGIIGAVMIGACYAVSLPFLLNYYIRFYQKFY